MDFPSYDLDTHNSKILVVEGGVAGIGNGNMAGTATSRKKSVVSVMETCIEVIIWFVVGDNIEGWGTIERCVGFERKR